MNDSNGSQQGVCESDIVLPISELMQAGVIIAYSFVGIASLLGNLAVLLIVICRKEMRTVTNIFISSVSAADLVITAFSLWATPLAYYYQMWHFGQVMCYVVYVVQGASLIWAPLTLAAIAIDRYMLVANPFKKQMTSGKCLLVISVIWIGAFLVLTPMLAHVEYMELGNCHKYCIEFWRPPEYRMAYGLSVLAIRSALPLLVISWCHWRIACILNTQSTKLHRNRSASSVGIPSDVRRKQRLQTLLLAMVVIFAVSSLPIDLFNVLQDMEIVYQVHTVSNNIKHSLFFISHWVAMTGTLLNPLVYAWWNENFRRQIKIIVSEFRGGRQQPFSTSLYEKASRLPKTSQMEEQQIVLQCSSDEGADDVHV